jgi:hypothetical protein
MSRRERDSRKHVKLSALLNLNKGFSPQEVEEIFTIDDAKTAFREKPLVDYMKDNWVSYSGKLSEETPQPLI